MNAVVRLTYMSETWNERLKKARLRRGLTNRAAFARRIGVSPPTALAWESGEIKVLTGPNLVGICRELRITEDWLLTGAGDIDDVLTAAGESASDASSVPRSVRENSAAYAVRVAEGCHAAADDARSRNGVGGIYVAADDMLEMFRSEIAGAVQQALQEALDQGERSKAAPDEEEPARATGRPKKKGH